MVECSSLLSDANVFLCACSDHLLFFMNETSGSTVVPSTEDINNVVTAAFSEPASNDLVTRLGSLPSTNIFSGTTQVLYEALASSNSVADWAYTPSPSPRVQQGQEKPSVMTPNAPYYSPYSPSSPSAFLESAQGITDHEYMREGINITILYEIPSVTYELNHFEQAANITALYLETFLSDHTAVSVVGATNQPATITFEVNTTFESRSNPSPPLRHIIQKALGQPHILELILQMKTLPSTNPFSRVTTIYMVDSHGRSNAPPVSKDRKRSRTRAKSAGLTTLIATMTMLSAIFCLVLKRRRTLAHDPSKPNDLASGPVPDPKDILQTNSAGQRRLSNAREDLEYSTGEKVYMDENDRDHYVITERLLSKLDHTGLEDNTTEYEDDVTSCFSAYSQ